MIFVSADVGGPEVCGTIVDKTIMAIMKAANEARNAFQLGMLPATNVVFCVPGSLSFPDWDHGKTGKYSTKKKVLLVHVALAPEIASSPDPLDYLIDELHGANALAFEFYRQKKMEYPLREATQLVKRIRDLAAARLEAQGVPVKQSSEQDRSSSAPPTVVSAQARRPTPRKHQLVLQWPSSSIADYDMMIAIENALIERLSPEHEVDGHDFGSGTMNIFIRTDDARRALEEARVVLESHSYWQVVRAGFNTQTEADYTPLWPDWLKEFEVI